MSKIIAMGSAVLVLGAAAPALAWFEERGKSKIDDSPTVIISTSSNEGIERRFKRARSPVTLYIMCRENRTILYIDYETFLTTDEIGVTWRIDKQPAARQRWDVSTNHQVAGLWHGAQSIPVLKRMIGGKELLVQLTPYGENPITVTFDIGGLDEAIKPVRAACKW